VATREADVIVIGAGVAGLAAARDLYEADWDVIVLEARNTIGGRVRADRSWPNMALDLGAGWIQTSQGNPVTALAHKFNIKTVPTDDEELWLYHNDGTELEDEQMDEIDERMEAVMEGVEALREQLGEEDADDISLRAGIDRVLNEWELSERERLELEMSINTWIEHEYAADTDNLSLYYWDSDDGFGSGDLFFPDGYDQIPRALATDLDIRLEHIVERIEYGDEGVRVTTNQGTFTADYAIVTLPLGVLKKGSVEFSPPLPARKQTAIKRLGMGLLNKVYLRFPKVFWARESEWLGYIPKRNGEWASFVNIHKYTGHPVLLGFNAGSYARQIEDMSDRDIVSAMMRVLRTIYGSNIPEPTGSIITRWASDPFSYGSYSYIATNATPADYDAMAVPVQELLFFAGEATIQQYAATVHGALLSGRREAKRILAL
jgi:monoamine oxidase